MLIEPGNNLPRVKVTNQTAIKKMIYNYGPIMRSKIATKLSLTLPTITTNINCMINSGIVCEVENTNSSSRNIGRKANPVDIVDDSKYFIGLEIRREFRRFCITNYRGKIIYSVSDDTVIPDYDENMKKTCEIISQLLNLNTVSSDKITGIGVCIPGIVDTIEGKLNIHYQYKWFDKNIRNDIARLTNFKGSITVDNNACARAYSVQLFQHELLNNVSSFAYLFISRGISCPLIINHANFVSTPLGPGELGYMIMDSTKPRDEYSHTGSLSSLAGERVIISRSIEAMNNGSAPFLKSLCGESSQLTMSQILKAHEAGEQSITDIISSAITFLGIAIANIDNWVHPDTILVDARLFTTDQNRKLFLDTVYKNSVRPASYAPKFIFIERNVYTGAKGGAALAVQTDLETYIE